MGGRDYRMKLLPSLKQKKRYLAGEIISEETFTCSEVETAVQQALLDFLGQLGVANSAPLFLKELFLPDQKRFVLKVNRQYVNETKSALALIKKIKNKEVIIKSLITSGTIKTIKKKLNEV